MRIRTALVVLVLAIAGCTGDPGAESVTTEAPRTTVTTSSSTSTTLPTTTSSTSSTTIAVIVFVEVTTADGTWAFPREACSEDTGRTGAVVDALAEADDALRSVVGRRVSGWPTTTLPLDSEGFEAAALSAAVGALVLAGVLDVTDETIAGWLEYEQGYADADQGWAGIDIISTRLDAWQGIAGEVTAGLSDSCA